MSRQHRLLAGLILAMGASLAFASDKTLRLAVDISALVPMPGRQLNAMVREVAAVWAPHGVSFKWMTTLEGPAPVTPYAVRVQDDRCASMSCVLPGMPAGISPRDAVEWVGTVVFVDGKATAENTVVVSVDRIAALVANSTLVDRPVSEWPAGVRMDLTGRALGRVLAHELGHYLLGIRDHWPAGLMRPVFRLDQLIASSRRSFEVPKAQRAEVQTRLEAFAGLRSAFDASKD